MWPAPGRMAGLAADDPLQGGDDLQGVALGGDAVQLPVVPGLGVHHRLGVEDAGVEVVRPSLPERPHRRGVGGVEGGAVGLRVGRVAGGQRLDPGALLGARLGLQRPRPLQRRPGRGDGVVGHRQVDVGPERDGDAPPADGAVRIQPRGLAERADRLGVIEAEHQVDALIEEHLGAGNAGRDRMPVRAQPGEHRRPRLVGLAGVDRRHRPQHDTRRRRVVVAVSARGPRDRQTAQRGGQQSGSFHGPRLPCPG